MTPRPPLDELLALFRATVAAEGITTGAGTAAGDNFIDAALIGAGANSFKSMLAILYPGDPQNVDSKDITGFDDVTGRVTLAGAYKEVAAAIPVGVPYKIVTFRFVPAEVAALAALVNAIEAKLDAGAPKLYVEQIPDTDFALAAIDNVLTNPPPNADAENSIVDIDQVADSTFVLRSLWVNITSFGTEGTTLTFKLWVMLNGAVAEVDSVDVPNILGIQNLMDLFGLPEVHADGIWITVETDSAESPGDAACSGTFRYAEAKI